MITFNVSEGEVLIEVIDTANNNNVLATIPQNEPFDLSPYGAEFPWEPSTNRIRLSIDNGEILNIYRPVGGHAFIFTQEGGVWLSSTIDEINYDGEYVVEVSSQGLVIVSPYNRLYLVDSEVIEQFANIPAIVPSDEGVTSINNTDFVIALLNIPFKLDGDYLGAEIGIELGELNTGIQAPVLITDSLTINLGEIVVTGFQGNSLDYVATNYTLILPFLSVEIDLKPEYVVDKTISVEYIIDAYSGGLTVNVYNGGDSPIVSENSSIGREIPFKTYNTFKTEIGGVSGIENRVLSAYIRVSKQEILSGEFSNFVSYEGLMNEVSGYVEVDNIDLKVSAISNEKAAIIQALANGVIIK